MLDPSLKRNLSRFGSAHEAHLYLDFVGDLLRTLPLSSDDPRFHFNPSSAGTTLPLTVGHRYMVAKAKDHAGQATWWLIHPGGPWLTDLSASAVVGQYRLRPKPHDLEHDSEKVGPLLLRYPAAFIETQRATCLAQVFGCAQRELAACHSSPQRLAHHALAYACALDDALRAEALGAVRGA